MGFKFDYANRFKLHPPKYRNIRKQLQDVWYCKVCFNIFCRWHRIFARLLWTIFDVLIQREIMDIIKGIHAWETGLQYSWTRNEYRHTLRCYYHLLYHEIYYVIHRYQASVGLYIVLYYPNAIENDIYNITLTWLATNLYADKRNLYSYIFLVLL